MLFEVAQYILIPILTFFFTSAIIRYNYKISLRGIKSAMKSQSVIHNKTKIFNSQLRHNKNIVSQSQNHINRTMLRVMVIDDNAYWVKNNTFFVADVQGGNVLPDTAKQVDTSGMSKKDIDKMMFILDKLKETQQ